jgi:molybdopterin converting factor small subunit
MIRVLVPRLLAECTGGQRELALPGAGPSTAGAVLDLVAADHPVFDRRVRDETGALRRHVNLYVDGEDVRRLQGLATPVHPDAEVMVIQSVAGG